MFETAMKYRNVKFWITIFIFCCIHLVQCKYLHRRIDDTGIIDKEENYTMTLNGNGHPTPGAKKKSALNIINRRQQSDGASTSLDDKENHVADDNENTKNKIEQTDEDTVPDDEDNDVADDNENTKNKSDQTDEDTVPDDEENDVADDNENTKNKSEQADEDTEPDDEENDVADDNENTKNKSEQADEDTVLDDEIGDRKLSQCWFPINADEHFIQMDKVDEKFSSDRNKQRAAVSKNFDKKMLAALLKTRGIAERAMQNFGGDSNLIPAGLNLGGHCMMRMPQSVLFFHRMKLRNNTVFRINYLQNNLDNMFVTLRFSLNDLHLMGDYERAITYSSPSSLYYTPTFGELEFLLRDVDYNVEGRYRLMDDRLYVEHIISELKPRSILMRYMKENNTASMTSAKLEVANIKPYLQRMQNDLDHWLKDYFNDFLIYFDLSKNDMNFKNQAYENEKTIQRNRFADNVIKNVRNRLRAMGASSIMIPDFKIYSVSEMEISLYDGVIRGLDTIYRRSVATGKLDSSNVRHLDAIVGFTGLKVEYKYNMFLRTGLPPLFGVLVLDVDDITARLALRTVRDSPSFDMHFAFIAPFDKRRSLVVEGPANRYIAKYKHILEHQITSIMESTMMHHLQQLDSLARCNSHLIGKDDLKYKIIEEPESVESKNNDGDVTDSEPEPVTAGSNDDSKQQAETPDKLSEDYAVVKKESIELEFPAKDNNKNGEKMKLEVNEKFSLTRLNKGERRTG